MNRPVVDLDIFISHLEKVVEGLEQEHEKLAQTQKESMKIVLASQKGSAEAFLKTAEALDTLTNTAFVSGKIQALKDLIAPLKTLSPERDTNA